MAKRPDWEAIEAAYRAGLLSIRNIAGHHGVGESTIRKRANKQGWQRDLSHRVKAAAKDKQVRNSGARTELRTGPRTDEQIVDEASDEITNVVIGHRKYIAQWKGITTKLAATLSEMDVDGVNHSEFARSLNSGVDALGKCIKLERQAYGMDDDDKTKEGKTFEELMSEVAPDGSDE